MKIYTKTGDTGDTGLLGGDRISKASARMDVIGNLDELNANLGLAVTTGIGELAPALLRIQAQLFDLGAEFAAPSGSKFEYISVTEVEINQLETEIDSMTDRLPPLKNFILPGGTVGAAHLHICRAVCRRAERSILELHRESPVRSEVLRFVNRLSDWLFTAARKANQDAGVADVPWRKAALKDSE